MNPQATHRKIHIPDGLFAWEALRHSLGRRRILNMQTAALACQCRPAFVHYRPEFVEVGAVAIPCRPGNRSRLPNAARKLHPFDYFAPLVGQA